mgnify:CR=1 FL=1
MFSVVIPLFNKAPYLQRTLISVFAQRCSIDEVIVVNDGSTDGGERIAKKQSDPRVRVIDQANRGVSVARNVGLDAATQPYVAFLDADDVWLPGFLEKIKEMIARYPHAGLYGTGFATVRGGREVRRYGVSLREIGSEQTCEPLQGGGYKRPAFGPVDFFKVWSRRHVIHTSSAVVPRLVALELGGFPPGVAICEDHEFWAKIALRWPVVLSPEVLTQYNVDVPGQAVEYWNGEYKKRFEVLPYHRVLAEELKKRVFNTEARRHGDAEGQTERSFEKYCKKEFTKCLLQRLFWGNFQAATEFYRGLGLSEMRLGPVGFVCGWIVDHPHTHGAVSTVMRLVRRMRERF